MKLTLGLTKVMKYQRSCSARTGNLSKKHITDYSTNQLYCAKKEFSTASRGRLLIASKLSFDFVLGNPSTKIKINFSKKKLAM